MQASFVATSIFFTFNIRIARAPSIPPTQRISASFIRHHFRPTLPLCVTQCYVTQLILARSAFQLDSILSTTPVKADQIPHVNASAAHT